MFDPTSADFWIELLLGLNTLRLCRKNRFLRELLRREKSQSLKRSNEVINQLCATFSRAPMPTLQDLARDIGSEYTLKR